MNGEATGTWIRTILPPEAEGVLARAYRGITGSSARVAAILASQSLHPEALRDHYALYRTLMFGEGALTRPEREAIAVAVSAANGCRY